MSRRKTKSTTPRKTVARLQETLLKAALLDEPLPGSSSPTRLSDLAFILRHPHVYLSEENLAGKISVEGLPKPLRVTSEGELRKEAGEQGDVAYLHFRPAEQLDDETIRLTLEGKILMQDPNQHPLGLSSLQVKFRKVGDRWEITDDPVAMAS